jgi:hypothetical protein
MALCGPRPFLLWEEPCRPRDASSHVLARLPQRSALALASGSPSPAIAFRGCTEDAHE